MPPKLNVAGSVELSGHEVCLRLAPTSMSSASTSATVPTLSLLDKLPPSYYGHHGTDSAGHPCMS